MAFDRSAGVARRCSAATVRGESGRRSGELMSARYAYAWQVGAQQFATRMVGKRQAGLIATPLAAPDSRRHVTADMDTQRPRPIQRPTPPVLQTLASEVTDRIPPSAGGISVALNRAKLVDPWTAGDASTRSHEQCGAPARDHVDEAVAADLTGVTVEPPQFHLRLVDRTCRVWSDLGAAQRGLPARPRFGLSTPAPLTTTHAARASRRRHLQPPARLGRTAKKCSLVFAPLLLIDAENTP